MSGRTDCCTSKKRALFSTGSYHYPGLKSVHTLNQISCPSGLTEMETMMEETLGIPAKHLQCAAVQVLALNFKLVSLGPGNGETAVGQSFAQAHYHFLCDCWVVENLWMVNCLSVGPGEIPLLPSLGGHPSATTGWAEKGFVQGTAFGWGLSFALLPRCLQRLAISVQVHRDTGTALLVLLSGAQLSGGR